MENRAFNKLDELLKQKSYEELSFEESQFVEEQVGGEQAYNDLRLLVAQSQQSMSMPVRHAVKRDLSHRFKIKYQKAPLYWLSYKTPVYANVLLVVVAILLAWYLKPAEQVIAEKIVTVQLPARVEIDTLFVRLPADTVFIEKRIRVEVPVYITATEEPPADRPIIKGSTLSDQQGLRELLVSGR